MQDAAAKHAEETGIGTVVPLLAKGSTWSDREELTQARLDREPLGADAEARIAAIEAERAEIEARCESEELNDDEIEAINAKIETLDHEDATLRDTPVLVDPTRKGTLTQFIVIAEDGTPRVEPGYWEVPRRHSQGDDARAPYVDPKKVEAKAQGLTGVLADELAMARRDVLALHIASNPSIALDLAIFTLADMCPRSSRRSRTKG